MLVSSVYVNDTEPLAVIMMNSILLPILSFYSCSVLKLRYVASLTNCSALNCVSLELISCSFGMMHFSDTILSTNSDARAVK